MPLEEDYGGGGRVGVTKNNRALITGASRGIGAACARALAAAGHPVVINYRSNEEAARQVEKQIVDDGGEATLACFDVSDAAATAEAVDRLLADERPLGVLVNNAGLTRDGVFAMMPRADWDAVLRTTLDGFYNVTRPVVAHMIRHRAGRIVNIASISGLTGNRGQVNYSAAKAGLIGATKALAKEVARRGSPSTASPPAWSTPTCSPPSTPTWSSPSSPCAASAPPTRSPPSSPSSPATPPATSPPRS